MRIIYNFLVYIIIILSPLIVLYRIVKKKENPKRFLEKFSLNKKKRETGKLIWFHCSSVGELLSIVPIIEKLENEFNLEIEVSVVVELLGEEEILNYLNKTLVIDVIKSKTYCLGS